MPSFRFAVVQVSAAAAAALLCLAAATQRAAAMLAYQPALRAPLIVLLGVKLYAPWKLFTWWLAFDAQAPHVFARAGALAALGGVLSGALAIGGAARRAGRVSPPRTARPAGWILPMCATPVLQQRGRRPRPLRKPRSVASCGLEKAKLMLRRKG